MLNVNILPPKTRTLFDALAQKGYDFPLVGGTALSLQLGHRESLDLDFVSPTYITMDDIQIFKQISQEFEIVYQSDEQIDCFVDGVKVTLFSYRWKEDFPLLQHKKLTIRDAKDVAISKASTIGRREELKDYIDLYVLFQRDIISLSDLGKLASKRFGGEFSYKLFLKQLLLVKRIEQYNIIFLQDPISSEQMYEYFFELIQKETIK